MIYEFSSDLSGELHTAGPFTIEGVSGTAEAVSVFGDIMAIMFADFDRGAFNNVADGHKIVFLNWRTGASVQIDPNLPLVG
jgi:hypothetical protein